MFRQLHNIDNAFRHVRLFTFVLIAACLAICSFIGYQCFAMVREAQSRIYVMVNSKVHAADASPRKDNVLVEANDHIKMFHHYFFTASPDEKYIEANISQALYLADRSAKKQYDDLKESGYYSAIISGNVSQQVTMDSIRVDLARTPYYFRYYGSQLIIRPSAVVRRSLVTEGYLRDDLARSDNNNHGFLIEKWNILENRDLETTKR